MRGKVLAEITEKNKLKEEVKEIRNNHKKESVAQLRKIEGLESLMGKLREENEQLKAELQELEEEYGSLLEDCAELKELYEQELLASE